MIAYDRLSQIVPADQALAAKALATSLQQIAGITNMTLPVLANTVSQMQTTNNLPLISALTQAVPTPIANYVANLAGTSGKPIVVCDVLGIAAGYQVAQQFANTVAEFGNINLNHLTQIYRTMNSVVGSVYGDPIMGPVTIPTGQPAAGTYYADVQTSNTGNSGNSMSNVVMATAADVAFTGNADPDSTNPPPTGPGLLPVAQIELANIDTVSTAQVAVLNSYFSSMAAQVKQEQNLQSLAQINFATLTANDVSTVYSLIYSLPSYGQQQETGGQTQFWEGVANINTFTGQAVVATLREGHNRVALNHAGVQTNSTVPSAATPPIPPANLIPSTYSPAQAANAVVT
jgi:hypothetical protein